MRLPGERFLALGLISALVACTGGGEGISPALAASPVQGPAADYPIVVGEPYTVSGVVYTPADTLNYDQVGSIVFDTEGGSGVTGAHHTLPLPSYVEVTSLESGRTILVRLERRGPMDSNALIALSPGAVEQLGVNASTPVRVRRVNPPEQERAKLRAGDRAAERMATPMSLVEVLKRKLPASVTPPVPPAAPQTKPAADAKPAQPAVASQPEPVPEPKPAPEPEAKPEPAIAPEPAPRPQVDAAKPAAPAAGKGFMVQAGAFSSEANAQRAAKALGGQVSKAGSFHLVRTGPFASRAEAQASLAKVRAAGYSDARIQTKD